MDALYERICAAIDDGSEFTVVVVLPEVPEGGIASPATQSVLHFQRRTISRKAGSLLKRLQTRYGGEEHTSVNVERYITFFSLRTAQPHPVFSGIYSEQVYVHSKLMIVDDKTLIIGSANINDRTCRPSRSRARALSHKRGAAAMLRMQRERPKGR